MNDARQPAPPELGDLLADTLLPHARGGDAAVLRATVRLLCRERGDGHVCVPIGDWQARSPADGEAVLPPLAAWREDLRASGLCGDGEMSRPPLPLVLDAAGRLYLRRDFVAEQRIVSWITGAMQVGATTAPDALASALAALGLSRAAGEAPDWQLAAVAASVRSPFTVITGGPGTGKTTTVARLLAVHLHLRPALRIAVCAPTGKAAARLGEALRQQAGELPALAPAVAGLEPSTLHRLLRYLALEDRFRAGPDARLPHDLVVVDEASMVDPAVLAALCAALAPGAALVLVGDRDQLAAVAAGQVLGDLCHAAKPERGAGAALAAFVHAATGMRLTVQPAAAKVADHAVALRHSHRFGADSGIGEFAQALAMRDAGRALGALRSGRADLALASDPEAPLDAVAPTMLEAATATDPAAGLLLLQRVRVLTATHHGPTGAAAWNRRIETWLAARGVRVDHVWYPGRPILVVANDYQNRVWNGDVGIVVREDDGRTFGCFPGPGGGVHMVPTVRLPAHETAWAMTVHKAQGSEFDNVLLAMPDQPGPWWQAPLLYTAVTRARSRAIVLANPDLLATALAHWPSRSSGLADALAAQP